MAFTPFITTFYGREPSGVVAQANQFILDQSQPDANGQGNACHTYLTASAITANPHIIYSFAVYTYGQQDANTLYTPEFAAYESDSLSGLTDTVNALTADGTWLLQAFQGVSQSGSASYFAMLAHDDSMGIQEWTLGCARSQADADAAVNAIIATGAGVNGIMVTGYSSGGILTCPPFVLAGRVLYPYAVALRS